MVILGFWIWLSVVLDLFVFGSRDGFAFCGGVFGFACCGV